MSGPGRGPGDDAGRVDAGRRVGRGDQGRVDDRPDDGADPGPDPGRDPGRDRGPTPSVDRRHEDVVARWHAAVDAGDRVAIARLVTDDVALGGPRGAVRGVDVLADWVERAGIRLVPVARHAVGDLLVVEQDATWPGRPDADPAAEPVRVATVFGFRDGRIDRSVRFESLDDALAAASAQGPRPPGTGATP